jgi:glycosyl hydrolase family 65
MAQRNLRLAADAVERHPDRAAQLGVDPEEAAGWRDAAATIVVPYDEKLGVHPQAEAFTEHQPWDFASTAPDQYPLLLHFPYFDLYRKQVVKQADLVLALHLRGDAFSAEVKARDFAYYEALTVRDSSLSACTQAVVAVEVGHLELAYDYFGEAALIDLDNLEHNTRDGLHIASLAGAWIRRSGRLRRHARSRRRAHLRPPAAAATQPPGLRRLLPRAAAEGRSRPAPGPLLAAPGRAAPDRTPRRDVRRHGSGGGHAHDSDGAGARPSRAADRQGAGVPATGGMRRPVSRKTCGSLDAKKAWRLTPR